MSLDDLDAPTRALKRSRDCRYGIVTKSVAKLTSAVNVGEVATVKNDKDKLVRAYKDYCDASEKYLDKLTEMDGDNDLYAPEIREPHMAEGQTHIETVSKKYRAGMRLVRKYFISRKLPEEAGDEVMSSDDEFEPAREPPREVEAGASGTGRPRRGSASQADDVNEGDPALSRAELYGLMSLSKGEAVTFDGDPLLYHSFILNFEEQVGSLTVPDKVKLSRLMQQTTGAAHRSILSCAYDLEGGYKEALKILEARYGNKLLIAETVIRRLKEGAEVKTPEDMSRLADDLVNGSRVLQKTQMTQEMNTQESLLRVCGRLPKHVRVKWKNNVNDFKSKNSYYPGFEEFIKFISDVAEEWRDPLYGEGTSYLKTSASNRGGTRIQQSGKKVSSFAAAVPANTSSAAGKPKSLPRKKCCILCKGDHNLLACNKFRELKYDGRWQLVKDSKLCEVCLRAGHTAQDCRSEHKCTVDSCGLRHSNFLHRSSNATSCHIALTSSPGGGPKDIYSYLPCVDVKINDRLVVSALLDTGSTNSFCNKSLIDALGIVGRSLDFGVSTITDLHCNLKTQLVDFDVSSLVDERCKLPFRNVYVVDTIPVSSSVSYDAYSKYEHLKDLKFSNAMNVQLLIGQDQSEALLPLEIRKGKKGEPFAIRSLFGWALNGPGHSANCINHHVVTNFINPCAKAAPEINSLIRMEDEGVCDEISMSLDDRNVVELWQTQCKLDDGRYELPIPFKVDASFPVNLHVALNRLRKNRIGLLKRGLFDQYNEEIQKLLNEGYAEEVPAGGPSGDRVWYLPHQAVVTDKKPGKLRVVFDCAARYMGESLNDKCLQGPNFTNKLLDVLLRFRQDPYVIVGDVQAMYYQVMIPQSQRDALRFLWYRGDQVVHYRMTRHVFGGVWCSSSSGFALLRTVSDNPGFPAEVVNTVKESFYVDDCLRSLPDKELVPVVLQGTKELLSKGGFSLTKFMVNDPELMQLIPESDRAKEFSLVKDGSVNSRALGVNWEVDGDVFYFDVNLEDFVGLPLTRRKMLSLVSSLYDPLGLVGPMIVQGRLVLQEVTRLGLGWDQVVPEYLVDRWCMWVQTLAKVSSVRIPRCIKPFEFNDASLELHNFSDASQVAYGMVSYLRCTNKTGHVSVRLVMAKSKVAPIKHVTIPRLELQAALLAARVDSTLRSELRLDLAPSYFWVDSEIVLKYLSNSSRRFQTFVANRVGAIQKLTSVDQWNFVPGVINPADLITRGKEMSPMEENRWFQGPDFLSTHKCNWPNSKVAADSELPDGDPELRSRSCFVTGIVVDRLQELLERKSSWRSLVRALVWLYKFFVTVFFRTQTESKVQVSEFDRLELALVRYVQGLRYGQEVRDLQTKGSISGSSSIASLNPRLDSRGILVVGGRFQHSKDSGGQPSIIPHDHPIAAMIASDFHNRAHCGTEWVVSEIRRKFWITKVRTVVKKVARDCFLCKRLFGPFCGQKMADLPPERVASGGRPFSCVGIDCFGPFEVKEGRRLGKRYGCIFTCFSIRAVHLEKLNAMDTDSFINAFRRFVARRGRPEKVWSDNGSNFVGASNEFRKALSELDTDAIASYGVSQSIEWVFNPPLASHMGGVWERLIRTVRKVFMGLTKGDLSFTDEILETWFCEVEAIVNGRPITRVGDDAADSSPLTPNHLLLLTGQNFGPPGEFSGDGYSRRWRRVQHLSDTFWKRWIREYLPELQVRAKWHLRKENLRVGDLVLLLGEDTPRSLWPLGVIQEVFPGPDGLVRSVRVKTKVRSFVRPITKIVLLEGAEAK